MKEETFKTHPGEQGPKMRDTFEKGQRTRNHGPTAINIVIEMSFKHRFRKNMKLKPKGFENGTEIDASTP